VCHVPRDILDLPPSTPPCQPAYALMDYNLRGHARILLHVVNQDGSEEGVCKHLERGHTKGTGWHFGVASNPRLSLLDRLHGSQSSFVVPLPDFGELNPTGRSLQQPSTQLLLQFLHPAAHCGTWHIQDSRRSRKSALACNFDKHTQMVEIILHCPSDGMVYPIHGHCDRYHCA
jgi:hypothetical protein